MATVNRWTGAEVRALRQALRLSVRDFAARLGVDRRSVNKWDARGASILLLPVTQAIMDTSLAQASDEVKARFNQIVAGSQVEGQPAGTPAEEGPADHAGREEPVDPMKRRTLIKFSLATSAALGVGDSAVGQVGTTDVARIRRTTDRLHSLDQQHGGETIWQAALSSVNEAYHLLERDSYGPDVEQQLLRATGRLQICAGWLCFDAGQHTIARTCYTEALSLTRQAGDPAVETLALANLAFQSNLLGQPREALRFADAAEAAAVAKGASPRLAAIPQLRLAIGRALVSDARDADRAVTSARKVLDRDADKPTEAWSAFLTPAEIDAVEASCAIALRRFSKAEALLERTVAGYDVRFARNLTMNRIRLAYVRVESQEVEGAAEAANAALDGLESEVASWRVSSKLDTVARLLTAHPNIPSVERFLDRYAALRN